MGYCLLVVFPLVFCLLSTVYFSSLVREFAEAGTKGDRGAIGVLMRELLYQGNSVHRFLNFRQRRVYFMYHLVPLHLGLEMIGFSW